MHKTILAAASLALCAAMPAAAELWTEGAEIPTPPQSAEELSEQDKKILFFCWVAVDKGGFMFIPADVSNKEGLDQCRIAGMMLAEGSSPLGRHPVELWYVEENFVRIIYSINWIICSLNAEYITKHPDSEEAEYCRTIALMLKLGMY